MAILVTGTPGTGKTTLAKLLSEALGALYISLKDIALKENFTMGRDEERDAWIVDVDGLRTYLSKILSCKEVVDTHVVEAVPSEKISRVVVLRLNPLELRKRLEERGYPAAKIKENVEAEVLGVVAAEAYRIFGDEKVIELDVTGKSPSDVLSAVLSMLEKGESGSVDWLEKYWYLLSG